MNDNAVVGRAVCLVHDDSRQVTITMVVPRSSPRGAPVPSAPAWVVDPTTSAQGEGRSRRGGLMARRCTRARESGWRTSGPSCPGRVGLRLCTGRQGVPGIASPPYRCHPVRGVVPVGRAHVDHAARGSEASHGTVSRAAPDPHPTDLLPPFRGPVNAVGASSAPRIRVCLGRQRGARLSPIEG